MSSPDTRQVSRDSLLLTAEIAVEGSPAIERVRVRNLSPGGMMAEGPAKVQRGHQLRITLRNVGEIEGSVAWVQENRFGVAFAEPIDPKVVRAPVTGATDQPSSPRFTRTPIAEPRPQGKLRKI